ncbi:MAG: protein-methionine-sulfoxide reductase heme-binding subunit MsrQ [Gemmobacter sp.]
MALAGTINNALRPVPVVAVWALGALPALWLAAQAVQGNLGIDPVKRIEHALGLHALQFLILSLAVTPLRRFAGINLIRFRRALGLLAFTYVGLHLTVWVALDIQFRWSEIGRDIVKRPYITIGMAGFALLLPLALTSTDAAIRRMGPAAWRRLHQLVYAAALAGAIHFVMVQKGWPLEPLIYAALVLVLLAVRLIPRTRPSSAGRAG